MCVCDSLGSVPGLCSWASWGGFVFVGLVGWLLVDVGFAKT